MKKMINPKTEKYFTVSRVILETIEKDGLNNLTHSLISRKAQVSRAWIYEYMGKDKQDLIDVASEIFGGFFTKTDNNIEINSKADLLELLAVGNNLTFLKIKSEPVIIKLYYRFRGTSTPIGIVIKKYEKHWLDFMSENIGRILKFDQTKSLSISKTILTLRLGFSFRIATSSVPAKELVDASQSLEQAVLNILSL
ncbi:MAG: hypothetical protein Q7U04_07015 [Bacteriovorax sp.]|nr:hypothetical protein [Bacteriovorax sp.]